MMRDLVKCSKTHTTGVVKLPFSKAVFSEKGSFTSALKAIIISHFFKTLVLVQY